MVDDERQINVDQRVGFLNQAYDGEILVFDILGRPGYPHPAGQNQRAQNQHETSLNPGCGPLGG